jgi:hypothetical protein
MPAGYQRSSQKLLLKFRLADLLDSIDSEYSVEKLGGTLIDDLQKPIGEPAAMLGVVA